MPSSPATPRSQSDEMMGARCAALGAVRTTALDRLEGGRVQQAEKSGMVRPADRAPSARR